MVGRSKSSQNFEIRDDTLKLLQGDAVVASLRMRGVSGCKGANLCRVLHYVGKCHISNNDQT